VFKIVNQFYNVRISLFLPYNALHNMYDTSLSVGLFLFFLSEFATLCAVTIDTSTTWCLAVKQLYCRLS